jgi:hypothetical protein
MASYPRKRKTLSTPTSCPYKTTGKITVMYIVTFIFLDNQLEGKRFWAE